ncbi:hypothetical protein FB645_001390 [Coemansia sp. IMI 203386]|nr:hypothetical protein FB645_001390 [Coemansia sp. IMI 203386]
MSLLATSKWQQLPEDILHEIFGWLYPRTDAHKVTSELIPQFNSFMRTTAWVCHDWRQASFPRLLSTAMVHVDVKYILTREAQPIVVVNSNVDLFLQHDFDDHAREMIICVSGPSPSPGSLLRALISSKMDQTAWLGINRLKYVTDKPAGFAQEDVARGKDYGSKATGRLNEFLSLALPSLHEITFIDFYCRAVHKRFPLNPLINEHIDGPTKLKSLSLYVDLPPSLDHYQGRPIDIPVLHIHGINLKQPSPMPLLAADSLVELTLTSVPQSSLWESFVPSSVSGNCAVNSHGLEFRCLRSLTIMFFWHYRHRPRSPQTILFEETDSDDDENASQPEDLLLEQTQDTDAHSIKGYTESSVYRRPRFPVLEKLGLHRFSGSFAPFVKLFTTSPIKSLLIAGLLSEVPSDIDYSQFPLLESLDMRYIGSIGSASTEYTAQSISQIETTVPHTLKHLALDMDVSGPVLPFSGPCFAHSLRSLRLTSTVSIEKTLVPLLGMLPNLVLIKVLSADSGRPIKSIALLIQRLREAVGGMAAINPSVRHLEVDFDHILEDQFGSGGGTAVRDAQLRAVLIEIVCGLPGLSTFGIPGQCVPAMRKAVKMLVSLGMVSQNQKTLGHLAGLLIKSTDQD